MTWLWTSCTTLGVFPRRAATTSTGTRAWSAAVAKLRHVGLHSPGRAASASVAPQLSNQPVDTQRVTRMDHQAGQERSALGASHVDEPS
jgi:hypothetical protein